MIRHVVCWKLKDRNPEKLAGNLDLFAKRLYALRKQIPEIINLEVGINSVNASSDNHDIVLLADFDSWQDLELYQNHPAHRELVEWLKNVRDLRMAVDFEI